MSSSMMKPVSSPEGARLRSRTVAAGARVISPLVLVRSCTRAEGGKVLHSRMPRIAVPLLLAGSFLMGWVMRSGAAGQFDGPVQHTQMALASGVALVPYLVAFTAATSVAGEFSAGVARSVYGAVPCRWPVLAGKAVTQMVLALLLALAALAGATAGSLLAGARGDLLGRPVLTVAAGTLVACVLLSLLGLGIGASTRRSGEAVAVLGVLLLVGPALLGGLASLAGWLPDVLGNLPMSAANAVYDPLAPNDWAGRAGGAAALAGWAALATGLGGWQLTRRDI